MSKEGTAVLCILALILGLVVSSTLIIFSPVYKQAGGYREAIEACEKDLPRSQSCVIIAVVKEVSSDE